MPWSTIPKLINGPLISNETTDRYLRDRKPLSPYFTTITLPSFVSILRGLF